MLCEIIVAITLLYEFLVYIEVMLIYFHFNIGVIRISVSVVPIVSIVSMGSHVHCACCTRGIICGIICMTSSEITSEITSRIRSGIGSKIPSGITSGFTRMFMSGIRSSIRWDHGWNRVEVEMGARVGLGLG